MNSLGELTSRFRSCLPNATEVKQEMIMHAKPLYAYKLTAKVVKYGTVLHLYSHSSPLSRQGSPPL